MSYAKFDYGNNDKCQKCNLTERIGLGYGWAKKSCEWCLEDFCNICIDKHFVACAKRSTGVVKPPATARLFPILEEQKRLNQIRRKTAVDVDKRDRSGTCWSVYTPPRKCETCDGGLCNFCNVGMIMRGSKICLNANRLPTKPTPTIETPTETVTPQSETLVPPTETSLGRKLLSYFY